MSGGFWLRGAAVATAAVATAVILYVPPAYSRRKKPTPTPTATATPTPTPEVKSWNFDQDKAHQMAQGWSAVEGDWEVLPDPTAPSPPNGFGLSPSFGREVRSLTAGLEYNISAVVSDPTEYSDFTLEASFKAKKGWFDCSGGLIFRYADPKNYYLLQAGCPTDFFALYRMMGGKPELLKQTIVPIDQGVWYKLKVVAQGDHISCYSNDKMAFDVTDSRIRRGRIGLWAHNDSLALFDDVKLTLPLATAPGEAALPGSGPPP
jgi:3-keto-disaccharide hydrolase